MDDLDLLLSNAEMQGTDEWLNRRCGRFTASRFADLMTKGRGGEDFGQTALTYIQEVATERITGVPINSFAGNTATDWGTENEPLALKAYEDATGNKVESAPFVAADDWVGGSPDGLVGIDGLLEIKCPFNSRYHLLRLGTKEPPKQYVWQIQGNLWISGRKWLDYVNFDPRFPEKSRLHVIRVERDDEAIKELSERIERAKRIAQQYIDSVA